MYFSREEMWAICSRCSLVKKPSLLLILARRSATASLVLRRISSRTNPCPLLLGRTTRGPPRVSTLGVDRSTFCRWIMYLTGEG